MSTSGVGVSIRRARCSDLPAIVGLWRIMMDFHWDLDPRFALEDRANERFEPYLETCLSRPDHIAFVGVAEDQVVGYVLGSIMENLEVFKIRHYGFVADLSVHPDYRRKGVGTALWNAIKEWFVGNGLQATQLNVSVFNGQGQQFWKECGFEDFVRVMWRDLKNEIK